MIFDAHSHLQFPEFDKDRDEAIKRMLEQNVSTIIVGTDKNSSLEAIKLAQKYENLYASIGLHPTCVDREEFGLDFYEKLAKNEKVVAIGECGMDLKSQKAPPKADPPRAENLKFQKEIFIKHIELALKLNKPLMIHCRDAHEEVIKILKSEQNGVIHFFSGTIGQAKQYLELGFYISLSAITTYSNQYDELIKSLPLNRILAETDSPFASPVPYRGRRNEPIYVKEVVKKLAEVKNISFEEMSKITFENARKLFRIKA